ncbi:hypothetical protein EDC01DRAFT_751298 [Geopyxis carbonaria]|nr:hypothetical protein EDC01DRAFT_751298 [Geopyxis carbonaria]
MWRRLQACGLKGQRERLSTPLFPNSGNPFRILFPFLPRAPFPNSGPFHPVSFRTSFLSHQFPIRDNNAASECACRENNAPTATCRSLFSRPGLIINPPAALALALAPLSVSITLLTNSRPLTPPPDTPPRHPPTNAPPNPPAMAPKKPTTTSPGSAKKTSPVKTPAKIKKTKKPPPFPPKEYQFKHYTPKDVNVSLTFSCVLVSVHHPSAVSGRPVRHARLKMLRAGTARHPTALALSAHYSKTRTAYHPDSQWWFFRRPNAAHAARDRRLAPSVCDLWHIVPAPPAVRSQRELTASECYVTTPFWPPEPREEHPGPQPDLARAFRAWSEGSLRMATTPACSLRVTLRLGLEMGQMREDNKDRIAGSNRRVVFALLALEGALRALVATRFNAPDVYRGPYGDWAPARGLDEWETILWEWRPPVEAAKKKKKKKKRGESESEEEEPPPPADDQPPPLPPIRVPGTKALFGLLALNAERDGGAAELGRFVEYRAESLVDGGTVLVVDGYQGTTDAHEVDMWVALLRGIVMRAGNWSDDEVLREARRAHEEPAEMLRRWTAPDEPVRAFWQAVLRRGPVLAERPPCVIPRKCNCGRPYVPPASQSASLAAKGVEMVRRALLGS